MFPKPQMFRQKPHLLLKLLKKFKMRLARSYDAVASHLPFSVTSYEHQPSKEDLGLGMLSSTSSLRIAGKIMPWGGGALFTTAAEWDWED